MSDTCPLLRQTSDNVEPSGTALSSVVPKRFKKFYMAAPHYMIFLPTVLWKRGGLKISVAGTVPYSTSLNV